MQRNKYKVIDLSCLLKATKDIAKERDFHSISEIIFDFIENLIPFNMAVIYSINSKEKELEVISCRGSDINKLKKRLPFKIGEGAVGWVARENKALLINDVLSQEEIHVRQFYDEDPIIRSFLAVPLVVGNKLVGIISISCSQPYQYEDNDVEMITVIASQGAALLELNNKIKEANKFSNYILENINSGVMVIDSDYKIIVFNRAAEKISGYSCEEIIGKSILEIPLKEDKSDWYIAESLDKGEEFIEKPGYIIRKDGKYVNIRLSTSIIRSKDNSVNGCICIFRDTTEIERLQQQIMRADKLAAIGRLTAGITHEIRNPLLPIRTASELLLKKIQKENYSEEIVKLIKIINDESERLNRFLDEFVGLNKEHMDYNEKTSLKEVIEDILILLKHPLKKNKIQVNQAYKCDNIYLPFSKDKLKQILLNVFFNSIDAINASNKELREISIKVLRKNNKALIRISDTGCGIKQKEINNIFDPFYTTKENGTGLGLSIIHNIINSVGGRIIVESELGKGTKLTIIVPVIED